ncbi:MAG TPA: kelch repeat-containing protein [Nitrospiria bacterium]|nr:kelch repeat-containing protein [Nitrospiria bacterium]
MPTWRTGLGVGVLNGILYAVGGDDIVCNGSTCVGDFLPTVEAYDPATNKWTAKPPMPTARSGLAVGVVNVNGHDILYAIGGSDGVSTLATVEAYDPVANSWTPRASMSTGRYGLGVGVVNGRIYAVGGVIAPSPPAPVEEYNPGTDTWVSKTMMPTERILLGVGVANDILYAVGGSTDGSNNLSTVEAFDPGTDTWTPETSMPTARGGLAVGENDGIIYAVGGQLPDIQPGDTVPKRLEAYNPATNTWTALDPMPTGRTLLAAGVVNGILYAVGGDDQGTVETFTPSIP